MADKAASRPAAHEHVRQNLEQGAESQGDATTTAPSQLDGDDLSERRHTPVDVEQGVNHFEQLAVRLSAESKR